MFSYLPAWRWAFPVFHSNFGVGDVISQMMLGIGGLLFDAADAAWFLLLWVVQLASSVDIAASAAKTIDKIVASIANPIVNNSYLLGFVLVAITATMMWRVIRGYGSGRAVKRALSSFVPLVILAVVFHASTLDNGTGNVVLSPAWIVKQVDSATNTLGSAVPTTLANVVPKTTSAAPSCETYEAGLTKSFANSESKTNTSATDIPETVNDLWLQSYLYAWSAAQFGNADNGERIACRYLESTNNISSNTQAGIEALGESQSGQTRVPTPAIGIFGPSNGVYNGDDLTASLTAWSACAYSGAWSVTAYGALDSGSGPTAKDCSVWWSGTQTASSSSFPNNGAAFCSGCNGQTSSQILAAGESGHSTATTFLTSYNGDDSGWSLVYGIFAGLASLAYLFALGALSLGTVLSQFMLIAVLCALPILLLMMSVGNRSGNAAAGMLKIGVGAVASKFCFLLVLGLLTELIDVINTFVGSSASPIMKVLGTGVAPLLAFYALHTLLRQVGMQGMMSFSGAIKMTAGIATGAHMRPPHDSAPRNRFEALDAKARGGLNNALNRGLTNSKPPMKEGGKSPDGNRNGGSRPPEVGTRKNASLYGGKKGAKTPALANKTSNPKGALSPGTIRKGGKASQIINNVAGPLTPIQAAAKRSFSKFSAPEASAARKSARSKAFKVGLGAVGLLAPGVAGAAAIGVAKTATFVRAAKKRATTAKSAITQVQRQRANSRGIANQIGVITNRAKKQQRQVSINKRKDAATAVISGAGVKWQGFVRQAETLGQFHTDLAHHNLATKKTAGLNTPSQNAARGEPQPQKKTVSHITHLVQGKLASRLQTVRRAGARGINPGGPRRPANTPIRQAGVRKPPIDANPVMYSGRAQPKGTMPGTRKGRMQMGPDTHAKTPAAPELRAGVKKDDPAPPIETKQGQAGPQPKGSKPETNTPPSKPVPGSSSTGADPQVGPTIPQKTPRQSRSNPSSSRDTAPRRRDRQSMIPIQPPARRKPPPK